MTQVKRTPSFLPETWPATVLFLFHAPCLFLFVTMARLPFMGQLAQVPEYNALVERYGQSVTFLTIYIREAHAVDGEWPDERVLPIGMHTSLQDRIDKGKQLKEDYGVKGEVTVDDMSDSVVTVWGAAPESWAIIRPDGILQDVAGLGPWGYDLERLEGNLSRLTKKD